ncbi:phage shock protein PspA [Novosphingobium rosa]|uniref:phage shock protein PspA n=1 Tax=Novosphingobium rosa TaxID=76978 RepID=UPI003899010C
MPLPASAPLVAAGFESGPKRASTPGRSPQPADFQRASVHPSPAPQPTRRFRLDSEVEKLRLLSQNSSLNGAMPVSIFSRTRDIIAANFSDLLDKAEDPSKMIRMIIVEMEETLVEVRASAARTIADQKEMRRHGMKLDRLQADWAEKAQLALSKDREDLARAALVEKRKAGDMADQLNHEISVLDDSLRAYEADIEKLQTRLREARSRQTAIAARLESAENRVKLRTLLASERVDEAMARFDALERRVDYAEGRADALSLADGSNKQTLADEIAALASGDKVDEELEAMKRALNTGKEG